MSSMSSLLAESNRRVLVEVVETDKNYHTGDAMV